MRVILSESMSNNVQTESKLSNYDYVINDLTVINMCVELLEHQYSKYMDENAKLNINRIKKASDSLKSHIQ